MRDNKLEKSNEEQSLTYIQGQYLERYILQIIESPSYKAPVSSYILHSQFYLHQVPRAQ